MILEKENGEVDYELAQQTIMDTTDGFLSTVDGVSYQNASNVEKQETVVSIVNGGEQSESEDVDKVGSVLLRILSKLSQAIGEIKRADTSREKHNALHRAGKWALMAFDVSDEYASINESYNKYWSEDVVLVCQKIIQQNNE
jgi:hypothetical protein